MVAEALELGVLAQHLGAAWLAEARVPMPEIAAILGHSSSRVTEAVYAKYSPDYLELAIKALR